MGLCEAKPVEMVFTQQGPVSGLGTVQNTAGTKWPACFLLSHNVGSLDSLVSLSWSCTDHVIMHVIKM